MINHFMNRLIAVQRAPNPFLAFREELCNATIGYANLRVLSITPEEKAETFGHIRYISGELSPYIRRAADFNKDIARIIWEHPQSTDSDLIVLTNLHAVAYHYCLTGWNVVRAATKIDPPVSDPDKEWFGPFLRSMLIFGEEMARDKLGLPSLFTKDDKIMPLRHSTFMAPVVNGEANPLMDWELHYGIKHCDNS
jgi:hypothetical protein